LNSKEYQDALPTVAIFMVTYNHEKYISNSIEKIISQETNFKFKLFIGEDCSKDNTKSICLDYAEKYPDKVEVIANEQNNIKKNIDNVWRAIFSSGAKYVAICEGDDYWIDPHKLQKQVDFLDANPDFSLCFSGVDVIDEIGLKRPDIFPPLPKQEFTMEDVVTTGYCFIPTASLFFRNILPNPLPSFYTNAFSGDIALHLLLTDKGKAKYFPENMAVYRHHSGGITKSEKHVKESDYREFLLYIQANEYFNRKYDKIFRKRLSEMSKVMLIYGSRDKTGIKKLKHYFKSLPDYIKYSDRINFKELAYYHTILFFPFILKLFKKTGDIA